MLEVQEHIGSAYWACYFINGDASGLDEREIALADKWAESIAPAYVVDVKRDDSGEPESPWFSWSYGLHTGDDCAGGTLLTYIAHVLHDPARTQEED